MHWVGGLTEEGIREEHKLSETPPQPSQPLPVLTPKMFLDDFGSYFSEKTLSVQIRKNH